MENGAEKVDGMVLGEEGNEVLGVEVDKGVEMSDKLKEEVEEEVFEEAVEVPEQLAEHGTDEGAGVEAAGSSDPVVVNESLDTGSEAEAFEDASSVPAHVQNDLNNEKVALADGVEEVQDINGGESIDKIDEGGTVEDVGGHELNGGKESSIGDRESTKDADSSKEVELGDGILPKVDDLDSEETGGSIEAIAKIKEDKDEEVENLDEKDSEVLGSVNGEHIVDASFPDNGSGPLESNGVLNNTSGSVGSEHSEDTPVLHVDGEDEKATLPDSASASGLDKPERETSKDVHTQAVNSRTEESKASELLHTAEVANRVSTEITVSEEPEKQIENVEEKKTENGLEEKKTESGQEKETQPAPKPASSIGKGTTPALPASRPAGLGRAAPLFEPGPRAVQHPRVNGSLSQTQSQQIDDASSAEPDEYDETREKLQMIRVKFLRLAHRLGQTPHNVVVAQVLYRLGLAEQLRGRSGGRVGAFSFDRASAMAEQLENVGQEPLDFSCTIMVLGKTGVGKSATINSIFDEVKFSTDAFQLGTKKVQDVMGTVQGIKVRVIDTPGLLPSWSDQHQNEKILLSVKRFIKKNPPDIVLYLDRLDMQSRDFGDMPLLRTITEIFGPSIWFNAIVVLTHAASAPPDGPNGTASSYDMFVTQRSHGVQQAIRQAAGDMRLMNPVSLVENHSACRTNRAGQRVLPNGQVWKPHLLLLSFASKILAEANMLLKLQDSPPGKPFAPRSRAPPLPFLLSSLLQSRAQVKLPEEQFGDEDGLDDDLDDSSDSDEESEYDNLPPFKNLTRAQVSKLTKTQKKAYFEELEYREKLFMKKQLRDEKRRRRFMKKMAAAAKDLPPEYNEQAEQAEEEVGGAASVPVPMPDLALPASFDSDNPTHRYRSLEASNQWLVRPVLDSHGWDHDVGYEGINVERLFVVKDKIPISFSGQVTKDKKDANVQMEVASSLKHGEGKATSLGFDLQTVGKDLAYTLRSETRFCNFRRNKATAGLSVTHLGDSLSAGLKVEDKLIVSKRFQMVMSGGAMTARGDVAYGGSLEAQLRDRDYPLGRSLTTLGLSVMDWHGDLAVGCNVQSQIPIGRTTNLIARANLNNRGAGQVSFRVNSSEQLQIALIGLLPLLRKLWDYPQQMPPYGQ